MTKSLAVFTLTHPWMQEMILKAAPPKFTVKFVDINNEAEVQALFPQVDFLFAHPLTAKHVALLKRCKLVQLQGVGYNGIDVDALI